MSVSTFKPVACRIPPAAGASGPNPKVSKVNMMNKQSLPHLQDQICEVDVHLNDADKVKEKEKPVLTATSSRREMMQLTAASIGLISLLLPAPAEARPRSATIKQKIMEKFEALRQKAGLSKKPKDEGGEEKSKLNTDGEEKKATGEILVPTLPSIMNGGKTVVETTLP